MLISAVVMLLPIIIGLIVTVYKERLTRYADSNGITLNFTYIYLILAGVQIIELFSRTYIINKERVKNGWAWTWAFFSRKSYKSIHDKSDEKNLIDFINNNPNTF